MPSKPLAEHGDNHRWYAGMQDWFHSHGKGIDTQPPFQYSLDCPYLNMMHSGTIVKPYMDTHLSHALRSMIKQLKVFLYQ